MALEFEEIVNKWVTERVKEVTEEKAGDNLDRDKKIVASWLRMCAMKSANKTFIANQFLVSARTVGRILTKHGFDTDAESCFDQFEEEVKTNPNYDESEISEMSSYHNVSKSSSDEETTAAPVEVVSWTVGEGFASMILSDGDTLSVDSDHQHLKEIQSYLIDGDYKKALSLANERKKIESWSDGKFKIEGDTVTYNGRKVHGEIIDYIIELFGRGVDFERFVKFYEKLMNNPQYRIVNQLYRFIKHTDIEIDEDGDLIAWKVVNSNYRDGKTDTIDNSVGSVVSMPRNEVDDNPNETCSSGLHVCAESYISGWMRRTDHLMKVKVNPEDVVSIPYEYRDGEKVRCCKYTVIVEV